jgi:lysophospholipase L1-like esterase
VIDSCRWEDDVTVTWTTSYLAALAAPEGTLPFMSQPRGFADQTVRQFVRLRRGGAAVRLRLSNEFGYLPLVIDGVTVSTAGSLPLPAPAAGDARWQIAAGSTATSDPVDLTTHAGDELVVTCFLAGATEPATFLHAAQRTGEVAPGNQLGRAILSGAEEFTSLYWISQVLTDAPAEGPVVVAMGDSITRGDRSSVDRDERYPDHLQRRLVSAGASGAVVLNAGIGGNQLLRPGVGPAMADRFSRDVFGVAEATHLLLLAGVNDIALPSVLGLPSPTPSQLVDGLLVLADRAAHRGVRPILGTITPFGASSYESFVDPGNEELRQAVNESLLAQPAWPVVDFAGALADPADPTRLAAGFDSGDGVHPSDAGCRALAEAIDLASFD